MMKIDEAIACVERSEKLKFTFSRRSFLKTTAIGGGALLLSDKLGIVENAFAMHSWKEGTTFEQFPFTERVVWRPEDGIVADRVVRNGCSFCPSACWHMVHVKDGRVINVYGDPNNPIQAAGGVEGKQGGVCAKGRVGIVPPRYNK